MLHPGANDIEMLTCRKVQHDHKLATETTTCWKRISLQNDTVVEVKRSCCSWRLLLEDLRILRRVFVASEMPPITTEFYWLAINRK